MFSGIVETAAKVVAIKKNGGNIDIDVFSGFSAYVPFRTDSRYAAWNTFYETFDWFQSVY